MNTTELFELLGRHWPNIVAALDTGQREVLVSRLRELAGSAGQDVRAQRRALQGVRLALVALPHEHEVRRALDGVRFAGGVPDAETAVLARDLLARLAGAGALGPQGGPGAAGAGEAPGAAGTGKVPGAGEVPEAPATARTGEGPEAPAPLTPEQIIAGVRRRLLDAPALGPRQLRARQDGASPPGELIRLADPVHGARYPAFQFAGGTAGTGGPLPVVLRINRLLLADIDPWGAADWWLSRNSWLGGPPASLLGELPDEVLAGAARALVEAD
ncbi:hypothetical protein [Streptomyces sp. NPDC008121]|uniref:hypothetical protein n=1 Tax=Streptomyces sp. NPDC008121 TaxID=3364809 RepID=UPI0036F09F35